MNGLGWFAIAIFGAAAVGVVLGVLCARKTGPARPSSLDSKSSANIDRL
jgi:hypothetical protein